MMDPDHAEDADAQTLDRRDTISPERSATFSQVLKCATEDGVDTHALVRLLWLLNAHPRLIGHRRCLQNLQSLMSTPEFIDGIKDWTDTWTQYIPAWVAAAGWATRQLVSPSSKLGEFVQEPRSKHHHVLMRHGINRHPGAGALWIRHHADQDPSLPTNSLASPARTFRLLQWHLFCSQAEARHSRCTLEQYLRYDLPGEWPAWPRPAAAVGLALRQFSYSPWDSLLEDLPYETRLDDFADALVEQKDQLVERYDYGPERQRIVALTSYFEDFKLYFEGSPTKLRRRGGGGSGGGRKGIPGFIHFSASPLVLFEPPEPDTGDEDVPARNATRVHIHGDATSPQTIVELESLDVAPGDDLRPIMDLFPIEDRPGGIHGLWTMRQATEAASQRNYWDRTQLTPLEVATTLNAIAAVEQARSDPSSGAQDQEARMVLKCMLILGCTQEEGRTIRTMLASDLMAPSTHRERLATRVVLVDAQTDACAGFALPAIAPHYTSQAPDSFGRSAEAAQPHLILPDVTGLGAALLRHHREAGGEVGGAVFRDPPERLEVQVQSLLKAANQRLDATSTPRLTPTKVSRKLPSLLARAGLDEVGVALLCADHRYEGQARLHYTQHRTDTLEKAYTNAVRRLFTEAGFPLRPTCGPTHPATNAAVGARLVVKSEELSRFVATLRAELRQTPAPTRSGRHRYHRAFLLYTLLMQGLLTGIRPTNQPERLMADVLSHDTHINGDAFVLSVVEKDDQYEARARAVAIPERLLRQFGYIAAHAQSTWRWRPVDLAMPSCAPAQQAFLDWTDDRAKAKASPVDPHWFARHLAEHGLSAAANFTRAYVRTWLIRDRCAEQVVDAFLGHASMGQSPIHMHATFDFAHQLREIGVRLDRMADELGLDPIPSKLAEPGATLSEG